MEKEIFTRFSESQNKHIYYLLSIAAACVALTLKRTEDLTIKLNMIWLALAILSWGLSFILGCYNRKYNLNNLYNNFQKLKVQNGTFELSGTNIQKKKIATKLYENAIESNNNKKALSFKWQWRLLILGAIFYIVWHILQMTNNIAIGS